jgi:hypothetical protein
MNSWLLRSLASTPREWSTAIDTETLPAHDLVPDGLPASPHGSRKALGTRQDHLTEVFIVVIRLRFGHYSPVRIAQLYRVEQSSYTGGPWRRPVSH